MLLRIFTEGVKGHYELETPFGSSSLVHPPSQPFQRPALLPSFCFSHVMCGPPKLPPSWHLARCGFLHLFIKLFTPLPQACKLLQITGRCCVALSRRSPAPDTPPGRGRHLLGLPPFHLILPGSVATSMLLSQITQGLLTQR